jgi:hypothetical protein
MRIRNTTLSLKSRTQTRTHLFSNLYVKLLIASLIVSSFLLQRFVEASGLDSPAAPNTAGSVVADPSPHSEYLWYEAEDMRGFATQPKGEPVLNPSWQNPPKAKAPGWGMNGTGTSAEWSLGGGSEWGSAAASADETRATIYQEIQVPRAGDYKLWVRYADWVKKSENFVVRIEQGNREVFRHEFGARDMVDAHDELAMYWEWVFAWDAAPAKLEKGPARISIDIEKAAEARRHVDAVLLTNDLAYVATGRRKPDFAAMRHLRDWSTTRPTITSLLPALNSAVVPKSWQRPALSGRDFLMPWNISTEFWKLYSLPAEERPLYPFNAEPIAEFVKQYKGARDVPIFASKVVVPVIYVNKLPEYFREGSPFLSYLRETKTPFAVLINYGSAEMPPAEGQAAWRLLNGEFKDQFLGWISGESIGFVWDSANELKTSPGMSRKELLEAHRVYYTDALARKWFGTFHTETGPMWDKLIPALSSSSTSFAHPLMDWGVNLLGMESAAVQPMFGMRIAFNRGAARQFGGTFLYYHAPNFGDTATTFTSAQNFAGPDHFFHSRYGATMGPSLSWYRKSYYLYYMAGASAIYLEQGFDQFFKPGPGEHPFQLNPYGRITDEFIRFVEKHPDRGTPYTPIAFLLDPAHGWEMTDYPHWPFGVSQISRHDRALRQLFGVAYYPGLVVEGEPPTGDRQAFVNGIFGDIFDVLVATETITAKPSETPKPTPTPLKQTKTEPEKNTRKESDTSLKYEGDGTTPAPEPAVTSRSNAIDTPRVPRVSPFKLDDYRAVVVGGHIEWTGEWVKRVSAYVNSGGTLVLNAAQIKGLPAELLGLRLTGETSEGDTARCSIAADTSDLRGQLFRYEKLELKGAQPLITSTSGDPLVTTNKIGKGSVVFAAVHDLLGLDERITPFAAHMLAHVFNDATPVRVRGDVEYLINRNEKGWIVTLFNNNGVYKPAHGLAQVDRTAYVAATITIPTQPIESAVDWINEKSVEVRNQDGGGSLTVSISPGAVSIIELRTRPGGRR